MTSLPYVHLPEFSSLGSSLSDIPTCQGPSLPQPNGTDPFGIIDWIRDTPNGYFNPKQELRLQNINDPTSAWMLYTTDSIEEGEILAKVPWDLIIAPQSEDFDILEDVTGDLNCDSTRYMAQQLRLGNSSRFSPLIQYLSSIVQPQLPSAWSVHGKALLFEMLGGTDQSLPPGEPIQLLQEEWYQNCNGDDDGALAASLMSQRGLFDTFMVPTFDWYTHRNGDYFNIRTEIVEGQYIQIQARRPILPGEPLHNSFDMCDECSEEAVDAGYGTPEIFRDYGIIEQYPQRWSFQPNAVVFESEDGGSSIYAPEQITFELLHANDTIQVNWYEHLQFDDRGRNYIRRIFRHYLRKLYRFHNIHYDVDTKIIDDTGNPTSWIERKQMKAYYEALQSALQHAIHSLENEGDGTGVACEEQRSSNEGQCGAPYVDIHRIHYDDLKDEDDHLNYIFPTCESTQLLEFDTYETIEELQTNYQKLWFMEREEDKDICMNLENTLQICSNYRPHYHEFFVHFPARFIDTIERVIFIGGGDSMLLHEVLKYPTLQKVVGLELDQQVTRKSFKHFNSQPHWDNDKVEWWYGDATKSLPLLPRDYWGSFDLVLVDLSETVMSFSVTKTMDIFSALSLLLKPEGIMVKNEPYIEQFSDFFDYSIHIFYGTPKICTQVLVMGSNQVDFLHHPTKDHGVDRLLLEPLDQDDSLRYKYMHDYRKTDARRQGKCQESDQVLIEHGGKAGIIEIIDAEQVAYSFDSEHLESTLFNVAKENGLTPLSVPMIRDKGQVAIVVMKEGYIVARAMIAQQFIAFDIHLWGAFSKIETLRLAIFEAVKGKRTSHYRIVAGGMHGTSTWNADQESIGIQVVQTRNCKNGVRQSMQNSMDETTKLALESSLRESTRFVRGEGTVAVFCGFQSMGECPSARIFSEIYKAAHVEAIWSCPNLSDITVTSLDRVEELYECEKVVLRQLAGFVDSTDDLHMVVLDPSAPMTMGQILNSIFSVSTYREALLADNHAFLAFSTNSTDDFWRKNILERYRKESHLVPVTRAEVVLTAASQQNFEFHMTVVDDRHFFHHLTELESALHLDLVRRKALLETVEATKITGGIHYYDSEYNIRVFPPESYDAQAAHDQATEQMPLGRQIIVQFEFTDDVDDEPSILPSSTVPTILRLNDALQASLLAALRIEQKHFQRWSTFKEVGDGAVTVAIFSNGCIVMVWDGHRHVDVNLFTKDQRQATADLFVDTFANKASLLKTLRDDQPRGPGRVVQFQDEII